MSGFHTLVVRGGWEGHDPIGCTDAVFNGLDGFDVTYADSFEVYESTRALQSFDLIVQCWSMGSLTREQETALVGAVEAGVGFAGWHGGVIGTCVANANYLRMVGGRFVWHPDGSQDYRVSIVPERQDDPIVAGLSDFDVHTEHYWVLSDSADRVLATSTQVPTPEDPWQVPASMPVAWTRLWGKGRVFVCTLGHCVADVTQSETSQMIRRGLAWAARKA